MTYSVFVVARVQVYLEGISALFDSGRRFEVVGSATSIESANVRANVVVVDFTAISPRILTRYREASGGRQRIVVFGVPDDTDVALVLLEAGAVAYVEEDSSADELYDVVLRTVEGRAVLAPAVVPAVLDRLHAGSRGTGSTGTPAPAADRLTPRERRVAELMGEHMSNKQIASTLGISVHTVKIHVHHVIQKLALARRSEVLDVLGRGWAHA